MQQHFVLYSGMHTGPAVDNPTYTECQGTSKNQTADDESDSAFEREFENPLFSDETIEVDHTDSINNVAVSSPVYSECQGISENLTINDDSR